MMYRVFFKQKTAYEVRISDWSSDVCSSDLTAGCFVSACTMVSGNTLKPPRSMAPSPRPLWKMKPSSSIIARSVVRIKRSEESRVGKEVVRTGRSRWTTCTLQTTHVNYIIPSQHGRTNEHTIILHQLY